MINQATFNNQALFNNLTHYINRLPAFAIVDILADYVHSDMIIFRCDISDCNNHPFWLNIAELEDAENCVECEYCGQLCSRLLADGTWQSQTERDRENQIAYQRMAG